MHVVSASMASFENLADYPFSPRFVTIQDPTLGALQMHCVDEGPRSGQTLLLLHGEPTWSYLYRHMILGLREHYRVVAPDMIGFGKSDKLTERHAYSYARQVAWMRSFLDALDLQDITLFCQDWGGLIGLRLLADQPQRFARVIAANTFLPTGEQPPRPEFLNWRDFSQNSENFRISSVISSGCVQPLSTDARRAYDAPFPDEAAKAGARMFPMLVPIQADDPEGLKNREAWQVLSRWDRPFLTAFSDKDPITRGGAQAFQKRVPGCRNLPHVTIENAGHFLQEDNSQQLVQIVREFMG